MKINLHIERLVLDGLPVSRLQGHLVKKTVETELTQLLEAGGLAEELRPGGAMPTQRAGNIRIEKHTQPGTIGQRIAGAVYHGVGRGNK